MPIFARIEQWTMTNTEEVLRNLGYSAYDVSMLRTGRVI
jgi:hypothetical protein